MTDFYDITESTKWGDTDYCEKKRETVLKAIKPICEAVGIDCYDYNCEKVGMSEKETLYLEGIEINCSANSIGATVRELIAYIFIHCHGAMLFGREQDKVFSVLTKSWFIKENGDVGQY